MVLMKLLLQVSWGAPFSLFLSIHAVRIFLGRFMSLDLEILLR